MRTRTRFAIAAAGGVLATALVAAPALASARADAPGPNPTPSATRQAGPGTGVCDGTGIAAGGARGARAGAGTATAPGNPAAPGAGAAHRYGGGTGTGLAGTASGTLTAAQQADLAGMAEEELLAHDLYTAFAADATAFARIADAETQHLAQIRLLLDRYGLTDPSADHTTGTFRDPAIQATYDRLLAEGAASTDAAYAAARTVESADLQLLTAATSGLTAPDVQLVYSHLSAATQRHLTAVGG